MIAGWSSPVARWAHNPKVSGSNPDPATNKTKGQGFSLAFCFISGWYWTMSLFTTEPRPRMAEDHCQRQPF